MKRTTKKRSTPPQTGDERSRNDPRRESHPGYAEPQLKPKRNAPKAPGEGGPFEPQNDPARKPGRQNG